MVLAERQSEILRNGRRSRGPSPNGHNNGTPDTSSDDDNSFKRNGKSKKQSEYEEKIRVGRDYQAVCPELVPSPDRKLELLNDRALLVWSPTKEIPDIKLEEYITVAKEKYGYNGEQALGMLFWHKHDLERAVMDLANFTPFPDEWTVEDKVLFEQAFQFHGKSFHRIRQMLPDKSIASLVKYYYSWKKTRHRQSIMDRQEKAKASKDGSENGSDNGSNDESDNEDKVQYNKQQMSTLKRQISECSEDLRPIEIPNRINARWTQEELAMAVIGVKTFGKDFQAIADTLGTKTEAHIRTFFVNYRKRYNLDIVLKEYEATREANAQKDEQQQNSNVDNINKNDMDLKLITADKVEPDLDKNSTQLQKNIVDIIEIEAGQTNDSTTTAPSILVPANKSTISNTSTITATTQSSSATVTTTDLTSSVNYSVESQLLLQKSSKNQENLIMEIDLDSETSESSPPKKIGTITTSSSVISKELVKATTTG